MFVASAGSHFYAVLLFLSQGRDYIFVMTPPLRRMLKKTPSLIALFRLKTVTGIRPRQLRGLFLLYVFGLLPALMLAHWITERELVQQLQDERRLIEKSLHSTLNFFQFIPELMNQSELFRLTLQQPKPANIERLNRYLDATNQQIESDAIYLMNTRGITLASSNFNQPHSFVGDDFSFRPYFNDAMQGERGSYLALGVKSGQRGYYFSAPIYSETPSIKPRVAESGLVEPGKMGVLVVKVSLNFIEDVWRRSDSEFLVYDEDGVVFFSSRADWLYRSLFALSSETRQRLQQSKRYGQQRLESISLQDKAEPEAIKHIRLRNPNTSVDETDYPSWYISVNAIDHWGLNVATLTPTGKSYQGLISYAVGYTLFVLLCWFYWLYRTKHQELQQHLASMNSRLEEQVNALTADLRQSNSQLQESVDHHKKALSELEQTQAELIQAAKLAVLGEFSAGLHHELAQPLQALQTYAENSLRMLQRDKTEMLGDNLQEIVAVTQTMSTIAQQFKVFARRHEPEPRPVRLAEIIHGALSIVRPKLDEQNCELLDETLDCTIFCEPILIEQVLVNLISNAMHALSGSESGEIILSTQIQPSSLLLHVADDGPGVESKVLHHLFEPFFTTRKSGLGLGLAIVRRIVESQDGNISVAPRITGNGLVFTVSLPLFSQADPRMAGIGIQDNSV